MAHDKVITSESMPDGVTARCLSKVQAAHYLGISPNTFARMVEQGEAPPPIKISARRLVWDKRQLDALIDSLAGF